MLNIFLQISVSHAYLQYDVFHRIGVVYQYMITCLQYINCCTRSSHYHRELRSDMKRRKKRDKIFSGKNRKRYML